MATIAEKLATLPVTDSFKRDENPLAGEWKLLKPGVKTGEASTSFVPAGAYGAVTSFAGGEDHAYWSKASYAISAGRAVAALATIERIPGSAERAVGLWIMRSTVTPETTQSGYRLRAEWLSGKKIKFVLEKWVAGVVTELKKVETEAYGVGSRIAIISDGAKVYFFASKEKASAFEEVGSVADATYTEGYSGVYGKGTLEFEISNFATGVLILEEESIVHTPNAATVTASMPSPESFNGAIPSATEREAKGLPLPFPSVLANPGRLGPPRFTASERKTLRMRR